MLTAALIVVGIVLVSMCLIELLITRLPLSPAIVYLAAGWLAGETLRPLMPLASTVSDHAGLLAVLSEIAVLISLFAVGLRLRLPPTLNAWRVATTLASAGMLVTIVLATVFGAWLLPTLGWTGALLLAAILAPTDPVLASEVRIRHDNDRDAVRVSLTAEGGLNDATASPIVMLALGLLGIVPLGVGGLTWAWHDFVWPICGGALLGWLFGRVLGFAVHTLMRKGHGLAWDELLYLGAITLAYGLARLSHTSAFLFVFAAALGLFKLSPKSAASLGAVGIDNQELANRLLAFGHRCERLAEVAMILILGLAMAWIEWYWQSVAFALLLVAVVRPASAFLTVSKHALPPAQRRLVAWFGIRGVGSLFYLAYVIQKGVPPELGRELINAGLPAIALSILLHGTSATPLMAWYRKRRHEEPHSP